MHTHTPTHTNTHRHSANMQGQNEMTGNEGESARLGDGIFVAVTTTMLPIAVG